MDGKTNWNDNQGIEDCEYSDELKNQIHEQDRLTTLSCVIREYHIPAILKYSEQNKKVTVTWDNHTATFNLALTAIALERLNKTYSSIELT